MMWSRAPSRCNRNPLHLQITCSAAQRNKLLAVEPSSNSRPGRARGESGQLDRPCRLAARARRNQAVHGV
eukprot:4496842-Prymnesium_polylepis.1